MVRRDRGGSDFDPYGVQTALNIGATQLAMPSAPPPTYAFGEENSVGSPPVPAEGLPTGWTMEQWNHYGQQWLDGQQAAAVTTPVESSYAAPVEPSYSPPIESMATSNMLDSTTSVADKTRELDEIPRTDILDFDL